MGEITFLRSDEKKQIEKILFERPISSLWKKNIGLLVGKNAKLKSVNDAYNIVSSLKHSPILVAEKNESDFESKFPTTLWLKKNKHRFENTDEAIRIFSECQIVIAGFELTMNPVMQLLLEKLLSSRNSSMLFSDEVAVMFKNSLSFFKNRHGDIYVLTVRSVKILAQQLSLNINNTQNIMYLSKLLCEISEKLNCTIVCYSQSQIIGADKDQPNKICVYNLVSNKLQGDHLCATLACLIAEVRTFGNVLELILACGFLLNEAYLQETGISTLNNISDKYS